MPSLWCALLCSGLLAGAADDGPCQRYAFREPHMGVAVDIIVYAPQEAAANRAAQAAFDRLRELTGVLSDYEAASELSRLSATAGSGEAVAVSDDLWNVLLAARDLSVRSEGAFDITVGPLVRLWRRARRNKQMPSAERLAAARQVVGYQFLELDEETHRATLTRPGMRLDLGGIGMGYAVDQALLALKRQGITRALVDASGDIAAADPPPGEPGWRVGIAPLEAPEGPPSRFLLLRQAAVTTSGDAFQHVVIDGRRYSHIIDPQSGLGLSVPSSVTVVAADCMTADSLATAVSVLGPEAGLKLVADTPGASALVVRNVDGRVEVVASDGFAAWEDERPAAH